MRKQTYKVFDIVFSCRTEPDVSTVVEVRYKIGADRWLSEFLNFETEHDRPRAVCWWRERSRDIPPMSNRHAVDSANYHAVAMTQSIDVEYYDFGYKIIGYTVGMKPPDAGETW